MPDYQQRVIDELNELSDRHAKLIAFLKTETFSGLPDAEKTLLITQEIFMKGYKQILIMRTAAFS